MEILINTLTTALISLVMILSSTSHNSSFVQSLPSSNTSSQTNPPQLPIAATSDISWNWAGYTANNGTFTGVSGTWTIPQVKNTGTPGADATWVGIGGITSHDLIQAGTQSTVNRFGQVTYSTFYEGLPDASQPLNLSVKPGDRIHVSLTKQGDSTWNITVENSTTAESATITMQYNSSFSSAEWIEEAPSGIRRELPLDNFGTVAITDASTKQNGKNVSASEAKAKPLAMSGEDGLLAQASVLDTSGTTFTVSRTTTSSPSQSPTEITYPRAGQIPSLIRRRIFQFGY